MAIERGSDPAGPDHPERVAGWYEERRDARSTTLASGTLACPDCDAPVALASGPAAPSDALACPYCGTAGAVRDFLSLSSPARPARVAVRVVRRGRLAA
jgi:hypothetical protein